MALSACAAITKYHRLGSLNGEYLFLIILEDEWSKIRMLVGSVFAGGCPPSLETVALLRFPLMAETVSSDRFRL